MKLSLNWIRSLNDQYHCSADPAPHGVDALVEKIGAQLGAVEEVIDVGARYNNIFVVKVVTCVKHPNADKLKVCLIDDGQVVKGVKRDQDGLVEVVCGAPNVIAGQLVAWLPPGTTVPSTYDKDPMVLDARELRGVISNGMLASPKELALGDSHEGLLVLADEISKDQTSNFKPGEPLAEALGLDDYVIDIENKMFTHRPDLFGQLGLAREIAGIQGHSFKSPSWYRHDAAVTSSKAQNSHQVKIKNEVPKLVPRFCALAIKDVKVGHSPVWLNVRLTSVGVRPINNIVDVTNFSMMETAQPLHAYDYDKLKTGVLGARLSRKNETLRLLNGKDLLLDDGDLVITDGSQPIGLAGIMGGADTEVDSSTKNIILECASFDMNQIRKTAMKYGMFTDASTRFTKNQSPRQNQAVIAKAAEDILKTAGGRISGQLVDDNHTVPDSKPVKTDTVLINQRLGLDLSTDQIKKLLENVEFDVKTDGQKLVIAYPFWRTDIEIPEDIVEEVGRLFGYDKLPQQLPARRIEPIEKNRLLEFKNKLRYLLAEFGANESLTYSFVHDNLLKKTGQDSAAAFKLSNALSPSLQYYRFSLVPSLLDKVHQNIKAGYDSFALFEIGKGHSKDHVDKNKIPDEFELLALIYTAASKTNPSGVAYYRVKQYLDAAATTMGLELKYSTIDKMPLAAIAQPYQQNRSAMVSAAGSGKYLGIIGEFKAGVRHSLKLPDHTAGFEIDISALAESVSDAKNYRPIPRFPETHQDLCLRTAADLSYAELTDFMSSEIKKLSASESYVYDILPLDIFQRFGDSAHKQTTWRITLSHRLRTLTTQEVNRLLDGLAQSAQHKFNAERI